MKVPYSWLKDFVDIDVTPEELASKLVGIGFEVEEIIHLSDEIKNVVVGKILEIEPHPNANKLRICQVDVGDKIVQIITHAENVSVGDYVPAALDGACLPGNKKIFNGELRGLPSLGMMCAGEELGLKEGDFPNAGVDGIMLLDKYPLGTDINDIIGTNDIVFDISVTANRPDCQSILGIAREVAALYKKPLKMPDLSYKSVDEDLDLEVVNNATDLCPRYTCGVVKDVVLKESNQIIKNRLRAVGLRPINNIVDITNYILIEIGQPMHAFDKSLLDGANIIIRRANNGEKIVTLDEKEAILDDSMLVIADKNKPSALAGIMGGLNSGINKDVKEIVFESAKFARDNIRRTSRKVNIHSDSSARYEKGIDFISQEIALKRAFNMIYTSNSGTILSKTFDEGIEKAKTNIIDIKVERIKDILGIDISNDFIINTLNSLGITTKIENNNLIVEVPEYREDIVNANDIAEEIIRFYGYDHIISTLMPKAEQTCGYANQEQRDMDKLADVAVDCGLKEIVTYSFVSSKAPDMLLMDTDDTLRKAARLLNPLSDDWSTMRTQLTHSMLNTLSANIKRGNKTCGLFEIAKVYLPNELPMENQPQETNHLCIGIYGNNKNFFTIKGILEDILNVFGLLPTYTRKCPNCIHPGRGASVYVDEEYIGYIGEVHPDVLENYEITQRAYVLEIDVDKMISLVNHTFAYKPYSKFQSVERDFAMLMKEDTAIGEIINTIKSTSDIIENVELFDIYRGNQVAQGMKSVAIKVVMRAMDRTLKDAEIQNISDKIIEELKSREITLR